MNINGLSILDTYLDFVYILSNCTKLGKYKANSILTLA